MGQSCACHRQNCPTEVEGSTKTQYASLIAFPTFSSSFLHAVNHILLDHVASNPSDAKMRYAHIIHTENFPVLVSHNCMYWTFVVHFFIQSEPAGKILEFCILHLAMSEISVLGTRYQIVTNEVFPRSPTTLFQAFLISRVLLAHSPRPWSQWHFL